MFSFYNFIQYIYYPSDIGGIFIKTFQNIIEREITTAASE